MQIMSEKFHTGQDGFPFWTKSLICLLTAYYLSGAVLAEFKAAFHWIPPDLEGDNYFDIFYHIFGLKYNNTAFIIG